MNRLATAPRPGTTLQSATSTANALYQMATNRPKTSSGRPLTGMVATTFDNHHPIQLCI